MHADYLTSYASANLLCIMFTDKDWTLHKTALKTKFGEFLKNHQWLFISCVWEIILVINILNMTLEISLTSYYSLCLAFIEVYFYEIRLIDPNMIHLTLNQCFHIQSEIIPSPKEKWATKCFRRYRCIGIPEENCRWELLFFSIKLHCSDYACI